jgi:thiamine-phosphate pyrophosphorylase
MSRKLRDYLKLYFITDRSFGHTHEELAEMALRAGVRTIQFREKKMATKMMVETARNIKKLTEDYGAIFIVNDRVDVALASYADGVHVGQEDMPAPLVREIAGDVIVGVSVSNVEEAVRAELDRADYLGAGPVFSTRTKEDAGDAIGLEGLREIIKAVKIPVVAIGGISHHNAFETMQTGCAGIAVISAIAADNNPELKARQLLEIVLKVSQA